MSKPVLEGDQNHRTAYTRIQVVVEVSGSPWDGECKINDVQARAREEALQALQNVLRKASEPSRFRIVGTKIQDIIFREDPS
jgi:hypothetical protein